MSKAPNKKTKRLTEQELAERRERERKAEDTQAERVAKAQQKVASGKLFTKAVNANGGVIPFRGGNADAFWSELRKENQRQIGSLAIEAALKRGR